MGLEFFTNAPRVVTVKVAFCFFRSERPSHAVCSEEAKMTDDAEMDLPVPLRRFYCAYEVPIDLCEPSEEFVIPIEDPGAAHAFGAPRQNSTYRLSKQALRTEEDFEKALHGTGWVDHELRIAASIVVSVAPDALRGFRVQIRVVNKSANPRWDANPRAMRRIDRYEEPFLFDVNLSVLLGDNEIQPTLLDLEAADFRYDNQLWVDGFNAAAEYRPDQGLVRTRYAPIARQHRMKHRTGREDLQFGRFAQDPFPALDLLLEEMESYKDTWLPSTQLDPQKCEAEDVDRARFEQEVRRFEYGLKQLQADARASLAFKSTMETFARLWRLRDPQQAAGWRRFQIVFIVSVIGGLCGRANGNFADLEIVDILWFPTGGGKTEAYLAIMIWQSFFDRLRGKQVGVTAMMRFPLRLLSLQQMQRVIEAIACAEQVRKMGADFKGAPFTVGFLVGSNTTKNKLSDADVQELREQLKLPFARRAEWVKRHLVVMECPLCHKKSVDIRIDGADRLTHYCTEPDCGATLPLIVIDDEVYRYLPTVLVGTIDKLALIGQNIRWRQLLGYVDTYCSVHGYSSGGKCQVYQCGGQVKPVRLVDPAPAIEIQDELHLLREDLGVVASHYETVAHTIAKKYGTAPMKVIASTATIQDHERHSRALYCRESRQFPVPGRSLEESFYAEIEDYDQRLFIGIMPRRLTHINALMQLMQIEHELLQSLRSRRLVQAIVPEAQLDGVLDYYEVVVTYTLRRVDQDRVDSSISSQVNPFLVSQGLRPIVNQPMTANTTTEEVTAVLDALEKPPGKVEERMTSVTATSMISHGVDVDRLNIMNFFGMPFATAEYIQSSSRVGRLVCGCVFVVYQAHKERERSHYQRFLKYHEFQNRLVEPVPLNRWATRGLHFTGPGLVMAAIFALYGDKWTGKDRRSLWSAKEVLKAFDQRAFSVQAVANALVQALHVEVADRAAVSEQLEFLIRNGLEQARIANSKSGFGACMPPGPMQSLRDVEESFNVDVLGPNMWLAETI